MFTTPPHFRSIIDHDGAIILDIQSDQFFSMNPVGAYIWERLLNGEGIDAISKALARDTGSDFSVVLLDVTGFLAELKSRHLLQ